MIRYEAKMKVEKISQIGSQKLLSPFFDFPLEDDLEKSGRRFEQGAEATR